MTAVRLQVRGDDRAFTIDVGQTILEAAMAQGLALDHACGGVCACSTCHVKVKQGRECLSEASDDELDQLDEARDVALDSRLGCQAKLLRPPQAGVVEIHEMAMDGNVMKMRALANGLELPAGKTVELKPGGYHVMMMDLKAALPKDSTVPLTLVFKDAKGAESRLELKVPVATAPAHSH